MSKPFIKLGDVATYINGFAFKPSDWNTVGLPIIRIQDLTGNDYQTNYFDGEYNPKYEINNGDILISWSASLGIYVWNKGKALLNQHIFKVVFDKKPVDKKYFVHTVSYLLDDMIKETHGSTMKHITKPLFDNTPFPYPTIEEQQKIAQNLDLVTELVDKCKKQLEKLDELVKSRFVEMFGDIERNQNNYSVKTLQSLINEGIIVYHLDGNHGGDYPRSEEFVDSGVPYIGANCIDNGQIDFENAKYLTIERANKLRKGIAKNNDVLFAHNATVGPVAILKTTEIKVVLSTSLTAYRCNEAVISPYYLRAFMQSDGFVRQYIGEMKQTTRNQIPITAQRKYLFMLPPLELQTQFAAFVEKIDKSKYSEFFGFDMEVAA